MPDALNRLYIRLLSDGTAGWKFLKSLLDELIIGKLFFFGQIQIVEAQIKARDFFDIIEQPIKIVIGLKFSLWGHRKSL